MAKHANRFSWMWSHSIRNFLLNKFLSNFTNQRRITECTHVGAYVYLRPVYSEQHTQIYKSMYIEYVSVHRGFPCSLSFIIMYTTWMSIKWPIASSTDRCWVLALGEVWHNLLLKCILFFSFTWFFPPPFVLQFYFYGALHIIGWLYKNVL